MIEYQALTEPIDPTLTDLSVNINPLGLPHGVPQALSQTAGQITRYPDPHCRELTRLIAECQGLDPRWVLCGAGADDLIWRIVRGVRPKKALLPIPVYEEFETALAAAGCEVIYHRLSPDNDFLLSDGILGQIDSSIDLVFLCNPGNPTGRLIPPALLKQIADACAAHGSTLAVDESMMGFADDFAAHTLRQMAGCYPHLVVVDAFTKLYALPGLRLGYCVCGSGELLDALDKAGPPFSVSTPAQAGGIAALLDGEYLPKTRQWLVAERPRMKEALASLGIPALGDANFLFFPSPVLDLRGKLIEQGVLLRDCSSFRGLPAEYCRAALKSKEENDALLGALKQIL